MASSTQLIEAFDVDTKHGAFYTGGTIQWLEDTIYCQTESGVNLLDYDTGLVKQTIGAQSEEEQIDVIQTFTTDGQRFVTAHRSGLMKLWNLEGGLEKMWKCIHRGPIAKLCLKENILASGGSDSQIRIWDLQYQACILAIKGCQGVVNVVEFHPTESSIIASADDGKINSYALDTGKLLKVYDTHFSKVTSIAFANDKEHFISCGRDKVLVLWKFDNKTPLKTMAVYEAIEAIVTLPIKFKLPDFKPLSNSIYVASAGENGVIRVWDVTNSKEVYTQSNSLVSKASEQGGLAVTNLIFNKASGSLAVITADHNIVIYHLKSFACLRQFIGFSDEILDITYYGKDDSHIAVATNSKDIKLYDNVTMSCQLLKGHEDLVLCLNVSKLDRNLMVSSGKDNSVRVWRMEGGVSVSCIAVGKRHMATVNVVAFFQQSASHFASASQDTCLKLWTFSEETIWKTQRKTTAPKGEVVLNCVQTVIAHEKEIHSIAITPNDAIIATGSQDKTVKLWSSDKLELIGVLKGHRRGVWHIRFSPVDKVLLSASADCTIKLWSVANLNCLKTLEGHDSSVMKAEFLSSGMQILSAGADGLIKLFSIKNSECTLTLDQHNSRIWALALKSDNSAFVSGGSDSFLIKWKNVTEERKQQRQQQEEELALQEQQLTNYLKSGQLLKALKLALKHEKPMQTLKIIQAIIKEGNTGLKDTIMSLRNDQKESLMNCALNWNTNGKNSHPAQLVINILLNDIQLGNFRPGELNRILEESIPYTERHFKRLTQMMQDIQLLKYTVNCMQPHARNIDLNVGQ